MLCVNCHADVSEHVTEYGDHACAACGLAGPRDVLEALGRKLAFTAHTWLEDRIVSLEQQLEAERDRRIEAERELERLRSPAAVLAEAERLLREACVVDVFLRDDMVAVNALNDESDGMPEGATLAEAYEQLEGGRDG